jgi:anti-sigma factor ChrR (cupin superfamily)
MKKTPLSTLDDTLIAALADGLRPIEPPRKRRVALRERILAAASREKSPAFVTVKPNEGEWEQLTQGIEVKVLHDHGDAQSFLLRLAPGAALAAHAHVGDELCVVLDGTVQLDDVEAGPGTYHLALAGSDHRVVSSKAGCTLFLRADLREGLRF